MFCKFCGSQIADDAVICPRCGRLLTDAPFRMIEKPQPPSAEPQEVQEPKTGKFNVCALLGFLLTLAGSLAGLILQFASFGIYLSTGYGSTFGGLWVFVAYGVALTGTILSGVGLHINKKSGTGKGFAVAGVSIGSTYLGFVVLFYVLSFVVLAWTTGVANWFDWVFNL